MTHETTGAPNDDRTPGAVDEDAPASGFASGEAFTDRAHSRVRPRLALDALIGTGQPDAFVESCELTLDWLVEMWPEALPDDWAPTGRMDSRGQAVAWRSAPDAWLAWRRYPAHDEANGAWLVDVAITPPGVSGHAVPRLRLVVSYAGRRAHPAGLPNIARDLAGQFGLFEPGTGARYAATARRIDSDDDAHALAADALDTRRRSPLLILSVPRDERSHVVLDDADQIARLALGVAHVAVLMPRAARAFRHALGSLGGFAPRDGAYRLLRPGLRPGDDPWGHTLVLPRAWATLPKGRPQALKRTLRAIHAMTVSGDALTLPRLGPEDGADAYPLDLDVTETPTDD